jgi:SAM-dependent methyltransferase
MATPEMGKNDWDKIYKKGGLTEYYDMEKQHPDLSSVIEFMKKSRVRSVLDVGCGKGNNLIPLITAGFDATGVDISQTALANLRKAVKERGLTTNISQAHFKDIPYLADSFDAVISVQTLTHGYKNEIKSGIAEIGRVLKTGGMAFITLPGRFAIGKERYSLVKTAKRYDDRVYIPTRGEEVGIPHFIFNKDLIGQYFKKFKIEIMWKDYLDYYAFIATKK